MFVVINSIIILNNMKASFPWIFCDVEEEFAC